MIQIMDKEYFCKCLETLRKYSSWESAMYSNGLDFGATPCSDLAYMLQLSMCGFDQDWSYDKKLEFDWIIEWTFNPEFYRAQERHGKEWLLDEAEALYDFLVFMNEHGWED